MHMKKNNSRLYFAAILQFGNLSRTGLLKWMLFFLLILCTKTRGMAQQPQTTSYCLPIESGSGTSVSIQFPGLDITAIQGSADTNCEQILNPDGSGTGLYNCNTTYSSYSTNRYPEKFTTKDPDVSINEPFNSCYRISIKEKPISYSWTDYWQYSYQTNEISLYEVWHTETITEEAPLFFSPFSINSVSVDKLNQKVVLKRDKCTAGQSGTTDLVYYYSNSGNGTLPSGFANTGSMGINASDLQGYPLFLDTPIDIQSVQGNAPCGNIYSNTLQQTFYGEPVVAIDDGGLACESTPLTLHCYYRYDSNSPTPDYLDIGAGVEYSTDIGALSVTHVASSLFTPIANYTVNSSTSLYFNQFGGNTTTGRPIYIRPFKTYTGPAGTKTFYGDVKTIVFLPQIDKNKMTVTKHTAKCAGDTDAGFDLTFNQIPDNTGCIGPDGKPIPLILTVMQYSLNDIAPPGTLGYLSTTVDGKTYSYKDGATVADKVNCGQGQTININNKFFSQHNSNFTISEGLYQINVHLNSSVASCSSTVFAYFETPKVFTTNPTALKVNDNPVYHIKTGETSGSVEFEFTGGTPPYTASYGGETHTYLAEGKYTETVSTQESEATTITFDLSDAHKCKGTDGKGSRSVDLVFNRPPNLTIDASGNNVSCHKDNDGIHDDGRITGQVSGGLGLYTLTLSRNSGGIITSMQVGSAAQRDAVPYAFENLSADDYVVSVTDAFGAKAQKACTIGQPAVLSLNLVTPNPPTCFGKTDGWFLLIPSIESETNTYRLESGSSSMNYTSGDKSLSPGSYKISLSNLAGCVYTTTSTIADGHQLTLDVSLGRQVSCSSVNNGSLIATVGNPMGAVQFYDEYKNLLITTGQGPYTISNLSASPSMKITVTDAARCEATATASIPMKNPVLSLKAATTSQAPCTGKDAIVQLTETDGELEAGNYTFSILDLENTSITKNTSASFTLKGGDRHTFKVRDGVGCMASVDATVEVVASPIKLSVQDIEGAWCSSSATGRFTAFASPSAVSYQLVGLGSSQASGDFSSLTPASYRVLATDQFGCSDNIQVRVPIKDESLGIQAINWQPAACELSSPTGSIKVSRLMFNSIKTGAGNISYSLGAETGSGDAYTFSALTSGNYIVTAKDAEGCTQSSNVTVTYDSSPVEVFSTVTEQTCTQLENAKITLSARTKPESLKQFQFVLDQTASGWTSNPMGFAVKKAGVYQFKVTDQNNCTTEHTETVVNLNYAPKPQFISEIQTACWQATNGELSVANIPNNSLPDYRYWIGKDTIFTHSPAEAAIFKGLKRGKYTVYAKDKLGCQDTSSFVVGLQADSVKIANIQTIPATCIVAKNGEAHFRVKSFDAANQYHLQYYTPQNTLAASIDFQGETADFTHIPVLKTNHYTALLTDRYGCKDQQVFYITVQHDTLNLEFSKSKDATCPGASNAWIQLKRNFGQGNFEYQLSSDGAYTRSFEENASVVPILDILSGNYKIRVKDANQCLAELDNLSIKQPDTIRFLSFSNNYIREKGQSTGQINTSVWKGNGRYKYEWYQLPERILLKSGETTDAANMGQLLAGQYLIRVQDTAKCTVEPTGWLEKKFTIAEPDSALSLKVTKNKPVSCNGLSDGLFRLQAHGGWGKNYTYGLDAAHTSIEQEFSGLKAGDYAVFVKDSVGVIYSSSVKLTQPEPLSISFKSKKDANCFQSTDGSISVDLRGGNYPYYFISKDQQSWLKGMQLNGLGKASYTVYARDTLGCSVQLLTPIKIDEPDELTATAVIDSSRCRAYNGSIVSSILGGIPSYSYSWKNDSDMVMSSQSSSLKQIRSGVYRLNVTDSHLCTKEFTFYLPDITDLTVSKIETKDVSCWGYADGSARLTITKGNPPYTVTWPDHSTDETINGLKTGTYRASVGDKEGCKVFPSVVIGTPSRIRIASISTTEPYCEGLEDGKLEVGSTGSFGNFSYLWSNGKKDSILSKLSPGSYRLNIKDSHQCSIDTIFKLAYQQTIKPDLGYDRKLCEGNSLVITPGYYSSYKWNSSTGQASTEASIIVNSEGEYHVEVKDQLGCIGRDTIKIGVSKTLMEGKLLIATEVSQNDTLVAFQASWPMPDSVSYWFEGAKIISIGDYYRKVVYADTGVYRIVLKSYLNDCEDQTVKTVHVGERQTTHKKSAQKNILSYRVAPNPNSGQFYVDVQLSKSAPISLRLANLSTGIISDIRTMDGESAYYLPYHLNVPGGSYVLYLQCGNEARSITLIIIR